MYACTLAWYLPFFYIWLSNFDFGKFGDIKRREEHARMWCSSWEKEKKRERAFLFLHCKFHLLSFCLTKSFIWNVNLYDSLIERFDSCFAFGNISFNHDCANKYLCKVYARIVIPEIYLYIKCSRWTYKKMILYARYIKRDFHNNVFMHIFLWISLLIK